MAFTFGFYNSLNNDRLYDANQFGALFDGIIQDGVFDNIGSALMTTAGTGMQVLVGTGKAWFNKTWSDNDSVMPLTISESDVTRPRIDAVVLVVDKSNGVRANKIMVKKGEAAVEPQKPSMTTNDKDYWEHPLAWVTVPASATEIKKENIEVQVGRAPTPFVTAILETTDISDLYENWEGQFETWFNNLKEQLSDDIVANLQRQIDEKLPISWKATTEEAKAGSNDAKYVTPKALIGALGTSGDTVYDYTFSSRIKTRAKLESLGVSVYSIAIGGFAEDSPIILTPGTPAVTGFRVKNSSGYVLCGYKKSLSTGLNTFPDISSYKVITNPKSSGSGGYTWRINYIDAIYPLSSTLVYTVSADNDRRLIDASLSRISATIPTANTVGFFSANSYWGYVRYISGTMYVGQSSKTTGAAWTETTISGLGSQAPSVLGVYNNILYLLMNATSSTKASIMKFDLSSKSHTNDIAVFDIADKGWTNTYTSMNVLKLFHDETYVYCVVNVQGTSGSTISPRVLRIKLSDPATNNWGDLTTPTSSFLKKAIPNQYLGTIGGYAYFYAISSRLAAEGTYYVMAKFNVGASSDMSISHYFGSVDPALREIFPGNDPATYSRKQKLDFSITSTHPGILIASGVLVFDLSKNEVGPAVIDKISGGDIIYAKTGMLIDATSYSSKNIVSSFARANSKDGIAFVFGGGTPEYILCKG